MRSRSAAGCRRLRRALRGARAAVARARARDFRSGGAYFAALSSRLNSTCSRQHRVELQHRQIGARSILTTCDEPSTLAARRNALPITSARSVASVGGDRAGFEPRHVQKIGDETVEALGFVLDRADQFVLRRVVETLAIGPEAGRRTQDRGQRRAQIVRDRGEQRRAQAFGFRVSRARSMSCTRLMRSMASAA
jgi:hypothetical protein